MYKGRWASLGRQKWGGNHFKLYTVYSLMIRTMSHSFWNPQHLAQYQEDDGFKPYVRNK